MLTRIRNAVWAFRQNISISQLDQMILDLDIGERSSSGVTVSETSGSKQPTVYSCINILSRDMSHLKLGMFERLEGDDQREVETGEHALAAWLKTPNAAMTPMQHRQVAWSHVLSRGNAYLQVDRQRGRIRTWPLVPARMEVGVNGAGEKIYRYTKDDGTKRDLRNSQVLHLFGLSFDGISGVSPIRWNMETIGQAIAVKQYGAAYFRSPVPKVIASGVFGGDGEIDTATKRWNENYGGTDGLKTIAFLPQGMNIEQVVKIPNDEAQFIETQKLGKEEIAQIYLMPMHRLQALDRATFSNIEHQDLEYVKYTLLPWLVSKEQSIERQFLTAEERERFFVRHNVDSLLRGDYKTRQEGDNLAIMSGKLTRNEGRKHERLKSLPGLDEPLVPLNMGPASQLGKTEPPSIDRQLQQMIDKAVAARTNYGSETPGNAQLEPVSRNGSSG